MVISRITVGDVSHVRLILPFKLPTWNQLFAMNKWQRQEVTNWIREYVSISIRDAGGSAIPMGSVVRPVLTALLKEEYYQMTQPDSLKKYRFRKRLEKMKL